MKKAMAVLRKWKVIYFVLLLVALSLGFATRGYFVQQEQDKNDKAYKHQVKEQQALINEEKKKNEELKGNVAQAESKVQEISNNITKTKDEHETNKANAVKNTKYVAPAGAVKSGSDYLLSFISEPDSWGSETASDRYVSTTFDFDSEKTGLLESSNLIERGTALHNFTVISSTHDKVVMELISDINPEQEPITITITKGKVGKTIDILDRGTTYNLEAEYHDF